MSFTLKGRLESRLAASLPPIVAACGVTLATHEWWPLQLTALMLAVGLVLDTAVYHRLLPYQPGWLAPLLGAAEFAAVLTLVHTLGVEAPAAAAYGFFAGGWLVGQIAVHAGFPATIHSYAEDGGELGRGGPAIVVLLVAIGASAGGTAWASEPPTVRLSAGVHDGPLILDRAQKLVGEPGAVVRGGIVITADDVVVRDLTVLGGEHGIEVDGAEDVVIDRVRVSGATLDGINVGRGSVTIRDCIVQAPAGEYVQGIDISFSADKEPSLVEGCTIVGGREGIVSNSAVVLIRNNRVDGTTLRGISVNEMSMSTVEQNEVTGGLGVGIFCGDYSHCDIEANRISGTRPDHSSGDRSRMGYGIVAHYFATATVSENRLERNALDAGAFLNARIIE